MKNNKQIAYLASEEISSKIQKLQEELNLKSPGEVIAIALQLIEMSMGREVEFKDGNKIYRTKKFSNLNQTVILDEDGERK